MSRQASMAAASPISHEQPRDIVYPVHLADGAVLYRAMFSILLRFNDVLDAGKLQRAISTLLEIGHWRKLGGRIKATESGQLEIRAPKCFTAEQPAMLYAHQAFEGSIGEHPSTRDLPQAADTFTIGPTEDVQDLINGPGFPATFKEMLGQGAPQLMVRITTFSDATLVAITAPHVTWDAFGMLSFLQAVELVLTGRENQVPPVLGAREDVLLDMSSRFSDFKMDPETPPRQQPAPRKPALPKSLTRRRIIISERLFSKLRRVLEDEDESVQYFNDADLLLAWAIRHAARGEPTASPITTFNCLNARYCFPALAEAQGVYTQNMVLPVFNCIPAAVATGSVGPIIISQLGCVAENSAPEQAVHSLNALLQYAKTSTDSLSILPNASPVIFINNLIGTGSGFGVDYSAAVEHQGDQTSLRSNGLGTVLCHYTANEWSGAGDEVRALVLKEKDHGGNFWIEGTLFQRVWDSIEEELGGL